MKPQAPFDAVRDSFLACVHCGLCLSSCPTYLETGSEADSPRGRIVLMRALAEGRLERTDSVVRHLDLCLGCRACETACPSGVPYGSLIEAGRVATASAPRPGLERTKRRLLARWMPSRERLAILRAAFGLASRLGVPALASRSWVPSPLRRLAALIPTPDRPRPLPPVVEPQGAPLGTVALLAGCVGDALFSSVSHATVELLAAAGWRVVVPEGQDCCGALGAHLGEAEAARRLARRNVNAFLRSEADWVATNAAGCGAMLREYGHLLAGDPDFREAAAILAAKARDVSELLAAGRLPEPRRPLRARVAYHDACHLAHGQGVRREPRALLAAIPGIELVELDEPDICCGSAGTYNLTEPEMSARLGARKARSVAASGAEMVVAGNPGCILQIRAALRLSGRELPVLHTVELLARAYHREPGTPAAP